MLWAGQAMASKSGALCAQKIIQGYLYNQLSQVPLANVEVEDKNSGKRIKSDNRGYFKMPFTADTARLSFFLDGNNIADLVSLDSQNVQLQIPLGSDTLKMLYTYMQPPTPLPATPMAATPSPASPSATTIPPSAGTLNNQTGTTKNSTISVAPDAAKTASSPNPPAPYPISDTKAKKDGAKKVSPFSEKRTSSHSGSKTKKKTKKHSSSGSIKESRIPKVRSSSKKKMKCPTGF